MRDPLGTPRLQPEPWRVKVVERIRSIGPAEREEALRRAGYNVFGPSASAELGRRVTTVRTAT